MANFIVSPNMSLVIPSVLAEAGPLYAQDINGSLFTLDGHNHSPGSGVPITPAGLNLSSDLTFQSQNAINLRSSRYTLYPTMGDFNPTASDLSCVFFVGVDLYAIDGSGNQIQITKSGFVNSGAGSISGLSGFPNASASYNGATGTFVWEQGIGQAANMDAATLIIRYPGSYPTPSGNFIALQAPAALSTGYALTFPLTLPGTNNSWMVSTTTGSESWITYDPVSLMLSSGILSVNTPGLTGIVGTQLANHTLTTLQISNSANILGSQLDPSANILTSQIEPLNFQLSSSCGAFICPGGSTLLVTNLSVIITTRGKPVMIGLVSDGSGNDFQAAVFDSGGSQGQQVFSSEVLFLTDGTPPGAGSAWRFPVTQSAVPVSSLQALDVGNVGTPGTYTYTVQVSAPATHTVEIKYAKLYAYEIA